MFRMTIVRLLSGVALVLGSHAWGADCTPGANQVRFSSAGKEQRVELVLPASLGPGKRVPLVIGLHPSGGTGQTFDDDTGLKAAATAKGFAVMFPDGGIRTDDGTGYFWNIPGVPLVSGAAVPAGTRDDLKFLADAIDHAVKNHCVDAKRVYVTGFSGGARMSSMVGCRLADRVTAVAPVGGLRAGRAASPEFAEPDAEDCKPSRPVRVLAIHGTDDDTNPFPGGGGVRWGYSIESAAARWASLDRCTPAPASEKVSTHVTRVRYATCGAGSEVVLYRIDAPKAQGGGHIWPGGKRDLSARATPAQINATEVVLAFFGQT